MSASTRLAALILAAATALGVAPAAAADPVDAAADPTAARLVAAFDAWTDRWDVKDAAAVVMRRKTVVATSAHGTRTATTPALVGSLSKAITGVCVAKLVESGRLSYDDTLARRVPDFFKAHPPKDPKARRITIRQLLTHSSGMGWDPTQGELPPTVDPTKPDDAMQVALALTRPLEGPGTRFFYNNVNYSALAMVVEAVTGQRYEPFCKKSVLVPAGALPARVDPRIRLGGPYGAWSLSPIAYARFLDHVRPSAKLMKTGPAEWPRFGVDKAVFYSIGMIGRPVGAGYDLWHFGALTLDLPSGPIDLGGVFLAFGPDLRVVAEWETTPSDVVLADLYARLATAAGR